MLVRSRRGLFLGNKHSRRGAEAVPTAFAQLERLGFSLTTVEIREKADLSRAVIENARECDAVIVAGGDGTINAVASGLLETGLPLGIVPAGTGNDLARTLGIPEDIGAATEVIAAGHTRTIDVGTVNDRPFFNVASIGLSVDLAHVLTGDLKRRFGRAGYAVAALGVLARTRPFRATIRSAEGSVSVSTLQIAVGNGRYYGGGNAIEKTAAIDDQRLDLYSLEFRKAWKLALLARSFRYGEHGAWDEVRAIRAREFDVVTRSPKPVNADGEIVTTTPAHFRIQPNAVRVFCPKRATGG